MCERSAIGLAHGAQGRSHKRPCLVDRKFSQGGHGLANLVPRQRQYIEVVQIATTPTGGYARSATCFGTVGPIRAVDRGKFSSVLCGCDPNIGIVEFNAARTQPDGLRREFTGSSPACDRRRCHPTRLLSGWVPDLCIRAFGSPCAEALSAVNGRRAKPRVGCVRRPLSMFLGSRGRYSGAPL